MKTIEEAAREFCNIKKDLIIDEEERYYKDFQKYDGFKAGAEFAQRWTSVEEELPPIGEMVLTKMEKRHGDTWVQHIYSVSTRLAPSGEWESIKWSDVGFTRGIVTHWRQIDIK